MRVFLTLHARISSFLIRPIIDGEGTKFCHSFFSNVQLCNAISKCLNVPVRVSIFHRTANCNSSIEFFVVSFRCSHSRVPTDRVSRSAKQLLNFPCKTIPGHWHNKNGELGRQRIELQEEPGKGWRGAGEGRRREKFLQTTQDGGAVARTEKNSER